MASSTVGDLKVKLGLNSASFDAGLRRSQAGLAGFSRTALKEVGAGFQSTASRAGAFGNALSSMGVIGIGAAAAVGGLAIALGQARAALSFADEIGDTAAKLAVSTDALQEYRYAVHQLGGDYKDADAALEGFQKAFGAAQAGLTKKAAKPFDALGLDAKSFKTTEDALRAVTQKISDLGSTAQQAAIADKLGLGPMLTALRAGVGEMDRLRDAAHKVGFVMDADLIAKAGAANDQIEDLQKIVDVQLKSAFVNLAPVLLDVLSLAAKIAAQIADMVGGLKSLEQRGDATLRRERDALDKRIAEVSGSNVPGAKNPAADTLLKSLLAKHAEIDAQLASRAPDTAAPRTGVVVRPSGAGGGDSAAAKAARERASALKEAADKLKAAKAAGDDYLAGLKREQEETGKTKAELILMDAERHASAVEAAGLGEEGKKLAAGIRAQAEQMAAAAAVAATMTSALAAIKSPAALPETLQDVKGLEVAFKDTAAEMQTAFDDAFDGVASGFDQLFHGFQSKNWVGAAQGLVNAAKSVSAAFGKGGTTGGKIGAAAGAADAIGQAVGGVAGSTLSGAAGGALTGFQLGGPIGAAAGAVIGGVLGFFSGSKAKKAEKAAAAKAAAEEAARVAAEAAAKALAIANEKRGLEIQIMELSGDAAGALAASRADELAAMDESNRALAQQVYDRIDAQQAQAKAEAEQAQAKAQTEADSAANLARFQDLRAQHQQLEIHLMQALGDAAGALAAQRQLELAAMDPSLRSLQQQIYAAEDAAAATQKLADAQKTLDDTMKAALVTANDNVATARGALTDAYEREASALKDTKAKYEDFAKSLSEYAKGLSAAVSPAQTGAEFDRVAKAAQLGDPAAMGQLIGAAEAFKTSSSANARTAFEAALDQAKIRVGVQLAADTATRTADVATRQLDALTKQVEALGAINTNVLSVVDAINGLTAAQAAVAAMQAAQVASNADVVAAVNRVGQGMDKVVGHTATTADVLTFVTEGGNAMLTAQATA